MASLTPGTLQKLLQNVGNQDFKVAGDHRSALLQVPSLSCFPFLGYSDIRQKSVLLRIKSIIVVFELKYDIYM